METAVAPTATAPNPEPGAVVPHAATLEATFELFSDLHDELAEAVDAILHRLEMPQIVALYAMLRTPAMMAVLAEFRDVDTALVKVVETHVNVVTELAAEDARKSILRASMKM